MNEPTEREQAFADFMEAATALDLGIKQGMGNLDWAIENHWRYWFMPICWVVGHRWRGRIYPTCTRCAAVHYS